MNSLRIGGFVGIALLLLTLLFIVQDSATVLGQGNSKKSSRNSKKPNVIALDAKAERLQSGFSKEAAVLAAEYERAGQLEKSKQLLELLLQIEPRAAGVRDKIAQLDETILSANEFQFEVDVSRGWGKPLAAVVEGRTFRIQAAESYRFVAHLSVGPRGFPTENPINDMSADAPCGALIGMVVSKGKSGKPFRVGESRQFSPKQDGVLFLRVNAPAGHKSTGRLKVTLSGHIRGL